MDVKPNLPSCGAGRGMNASGYDIQFFLKGFAGFGQLYFEDFHFSLYISVYFLACSDYSRFALKVLRVSILKLLSVYTRKCEQETIRMN